MPSVEQETTERSCSLPLAYNCKLMWPTAAVFLSTVRSYLQNKPQTCKQNHMMNCSTSKGIQKGSYLGLHRCSCAWAHRNISVLSTAVLRICQNTPEIVWPFFPLCKSEVLVLYKLKKKRCIQRVVELTIFKQKKCGRMA